MAVSSIQKVKVSSLVPFQKDSVKNQTTVEKYKLTQSIKKNGLKVPLVVWDNDNTRYVLDGHHRLNALKELEVDMVEAVIYDSNQIKTRKKAKELYAYLNAKFSKINRSEYTSFLDDLDLDLEIDLNFDFDFKLGISKENKRDTPKPKPKPPLVYYGGKTTIIKYLLTIIPEHRTYVEPFCGGASLYWGKEPSQDEVLNDRNMNIYCFYKILKTQPLGLAKRVEIMLQHEGYFKKCKDRLKNDPNLTELDRAEIFFFLTVFSFNNMGTDFKAAPEDNDHKMIKVDQMVENFEYYANRLHDTAIWQRDVLKVITSMDKEDTFFYLDPPYIDARYGGFYGDYTETDYENLLVSLKDIQGKFLLSSYPTDILNTHVKKNDWYYNEIISSKPSLNRSPNKGKPRIECLTSNYKIEKTYNL